MKKIFMKSFLGVPVAIFLYELINIAFSIAIYGNQYLRLDGFDLNQIIIIYIELAIFGYLMTFLTLYTSELNYKEKNEIQKARKDAKFSTIIYICVILIIGFVAIFNDTYATAIAFPIILVVFGIVNMVKSIIDEKNIKKINKKIKENEIKK